MKLPTIKQLRYFVALTETGHFGRAAEFCFVSQSAFSNAIQELESLLDTQLVDRTNRSVTVTATGQQVATQARLCLRDVESLVEIARGNRQPLTGDLHLGVIPTIAPFMLPGALPKLRKHFPELRLFLHEEQTQRIYERLMDGECCRCSEIASPSPIAKVQRRSTRRTIVSIVSMPTAFSCWRMATALGITRSRPAKFAIRKR
jgi:LysR family hydrogen peroxide-inducible transcriptional activator